MIMYDVCTYAVSCMVKLTQTRTCHQTQKTPRLQVSHQLFLTTALLTVDSIEMLFTRV